MSECGGTQTGEPTEPAGETIFAKSYLQRYKRAFYNYLVCNLTLHTNLAYIDEQARDMFDTLTEQMKENEGITEELKEQNQL